MGWWWSSGNGAGGGSDEKKEEKPKSLSPTKAGKDAATAFDPAKLPPLEKLPPRLQKIVDDSDKDESFYDNMVDGYGPESTDTNIRYAAYTTRIKTILSSAHRYVAYTSDIGESFRPVAHPVLVRGAYGISWLYILGDVSYEGYKAYLQNQRTLNPHMPLSRRQEAMTGLASPDGGGPGIEDIKPGVVTPLNDYRTVMVQRGIFQSLASMGLPAFTIHSVVRYSGRAMKDVKNTRLRTYGPIGLGLAIVPFLPSIFDEPVENAVEWVFHKGFETYGGKTFVGNAPTTGREDLLNKRRKEKEL